ncbi:hypothetical protein HYX70_01005 [Candidatus Saccharibacteria bacterium]|nr:hypothetical protein [Candidatus Saccharibacteria bacterium]
MKKVAFIVPGYTETPERKGVDEISKRLAQQSFETVKVNIDWRYKIMSDYVVQFNELYNSKSGDFNLVLGFSFGAMIATISAAKFCPDRLVLCSLSPFFAEDMETIPDSWAKSIGKHRAADFKSFSLLEAGKKIKSKTTLLVGEKESVREPEMMTVAKRANSVIRESTLKVVPNGKHDIGQKEYLSAIMEII